MPRPYLEREQLAQIIEAELHHHHSHCRSIAQSTERIIKKIYEMAETEPSKKRKSGKSGWDAWKKRKAEDTAVSCLICAMLCWDPWPCLGHVRIGWNNIGVGRNHKEGNHGIRWQNMGLLCFYWDILGPAGKLEEIVHGPEPSEHRERFFAAKKETALWAVYRYLPVIDTEKRIEQNWAVEYCRKDNESPMEVQWKPQDIFNIFVWKYLLHDTLGATFWFLPLNLVCWGVCPFQELDGSSCGPSMVKKEISTLPTRHFAKLKPHSGSSPSQDRHKYVELCCVTSANNIVSRVERFDMGFLRVVLCRKWLVRPMRGRWGRHCSSCVAMSTQEAF